MLQPILNGDVSSFLAQIRGQKEYEPGIIVAVTCEGYVMLVNYEKSNSGEFILPQSKWKSYYSMQDVVWTMMRDEYGVAPPVRGSEGWNDPVSSLDLCYLNTAPRGFMWRGKQAKAMLTAQFRLSSMSDINLATHRKLFLPDNLPREVKWVRATNHFDLDVIKRRELKPLAEKKDDKRRAQIAIIARACGIDYEFDKAA